MSHRIVCLVSANAEWKAVRGLIHADQIFQSPFGEYFDFNLAAGESVRMVHGGWGKISAAASAQFIIDHFQPDLIINLGTCGGFAGAIQKGTLIIVERSIVYDIYELMGDPVEHVQHYSTTIDLDWLGKAPLPGGYQRGLLVSGDRDLMVEDILHLKEEYGAYAGDWESGAIAWVAKKNSVRVLIIRGVSDLVGPMGNETYGNIALFASSAEKLMEKMLSDLPYWISRFYLFKTLKDQLIQPPG